jgi:hypothetical protein
MAHSTPQPPHFLSHAAANLACCSPPAPRLSWPSPAKLRILTPVIPSWRPHPSASNLGLWPTLAAGLPAGVEDDGVRPRTVRFSYGWPLPSIHRPGAPLLVHGNMRASGRAIPTRSSAASKVTDARCYAGVSAGSPYGREAMDAAVSGASEGREGRVHVLQALDPKPHCRSRRAPRQSISRSKFPPLLALEAIAWCPIFPPKRHPKVADLA